MGRKAFLVVMLLGCGGSPQATDGGAEAAADDAAADTALEASVDAAPPADANVDAGIPPLTCSGEVNEPNDKEVFATYLGSINDCDSNGSSFSDVSSGEGDVDWYRFSGTSPTNLCIVDPTVTINAAGLRLCAFALCVEGTTTIDSCSGGSQATSPAGTGGCCTTGTGAMTVKLTCSSLTNAADVYIRVDQPTSNTCIPYNVAYHY
jgi:hypothetical protein